MENKYYTPSIEDFHVGFEYEELEMGSKEKFNKTILDEWNGLSGYIDGTTDLYEIARGRKKVRVKYLDKEDIESFGFEGQKSNTVFFKMDGYRLVHWLDKPERITTIFKLYPDGDEEVIFKGIIKNKSELKILLKQLNIK